MSAKDYEIGELTIQLTKAQQSKAELVQISIGLYAKVTELEEKVEELEATLEEYKG
jgi:hypothetical protein